MCPSRMPFAIPHTRTIHSHPGPPRRRKRGTPEIKTMPLDRTMPRMFGIAGASVLMLGLLLMHYHRTKTDFDFDLHADYPRMQLPTASKARDIDIGYGVRTLSWTEKKGWVADGVGAIRDEQLDLYLKKTVERHQGRGWRPAVRIRVPADAPARHFVNLARHAQRAGIAIILVAVIHPNALR